MNQYDFDLLLKKYLAGQCTPQEQQLILDWSENMLRSSRVAVSPCEKEKIRKRIWKRLNAARRPSWLYNRQWLATGIAASVLMLMFYSASLFFTSSPVKKTADRAAMSETVLSEGRIEVKNNSDSPHRLVLEHGTAVVLKPQSILHYPKHFGPKARMVALSGEAFFEVTKDASRPFFVYTGELVTRVLGTSFYVKSDHAAATVEVSVVTGRVSVYENTRKTAQKRNGVLLTPNQKIRFDSQIKTLVPELVEDPVIVHAPEKKESFIFDETPLTQVTGQIQKVYGIEIVLESQALERCVFTGDLNDLPLYTKLRMVCKSVNAAYELRGTTLFISGEGCTN